MLSSIPFKLIVVLALSHLVHSNLIDGQKGSTKEIYKGIPYFNAFWPTLWQAAEADIERGMLALVTILRHKE